MTSTVDIYDISTWETARGLYLLYKSQAEEAEWNGDQNAAELWRRAETYKAMGDVVIPPF